MRTYYYTLLVLLFSMGSALAQGRDALVGRWLTSGGDAHIQIAPDGSKYSGKIVWLKEPNEPSGKPKTDDENPNEALRKRSVLGMELLDNFRYSQDGLWEGGTIYDPKTGKTYSCKITLVNKDKINVRGFVGISLLGRTETWTRVR